MYVSMYQAQGPLRGPWNRPAGIGPWSDDREKVKGPDVPSQQTDGMSAHTRSRVSALGLITREL